MRRRRMLSLAVVPIAVAASVAFGTVAAAGQADAAISLTVSVGGETAAAPGPPLPEGLPITLVFTAANIGSEPLEDLALGGGLLGPIDCPVTSLAPGASVTCERATEVVGGRYRSRTVVSATAADGSPVEASVRVGYTGVSPDWVAAVDLEVLLDGNPSTSPGPTLVPGDPVGITYRVVNRGTVPLDRVKVVDSQGLEVICPTRTVESGQSIECTAVGTVVEGRHTERARVRAWDPGGTRVESRLRYHYAGEPRILRAEFGGETLAGKAPASTEPGPLLRAGRKVRWGVDVTNTGEDDLWGLYAQDGEEGRLECRDRHVAPGATVRCIVWGRATLGPMEGEITVTAWATDGRQVTHVFERHAFGYRPGAALVIETYVDGFDADVHAGPRRPLGEPIELTYVVSNAGTVGLRSLKVTDALFGAIHCPRRVLGPGSTMVCTRTAVAELGWWETTGKARGRSTTGIVSDTDKTFWHVRSVARASSIGLRVTVDGVNLARQKARAFVAGDVVEVVYVATNTGNSPLWSIEIRDPNVPASAMTCTGSSDPGPGDTLRCRATMVIRSSEHWYDVEAVAWNNDGSKIVGGSFIHYRGVAGPT